MSRISALLVLAIACGGSNTGSDTAPMSAPDNVAPADTPPAGPDCDTPPAAVAPEQGRTATEAFTVTDSDNATAAGTVRVFSINDSILELRSEGGSDDIEIYGINECGLWIQEVNMGSEIGGDPERRDTKITLITETDGAFAIERLGAKLSVVREGQSFKVTNVETIPAYVGE